MKKSLRIASGLVLTGLSGLSATNALAQSSCSLPLSSYESYVSLNQLDLAGGVVTNHPECFAGGSTASSIQINASTFRQASAISSAIAARNPQALAGPTASLTGVQGLAAGGVGQSWNIWASHNETASNLSYNVGAVARRTETDVGTTVFGGDIAISPTMAAGVSLAIDRTKSVGVGGVSSANNGFSVAPYLGYQLSKELALDISAGYGQSEFAGGNIRADADRWFAAANLSHSSWAGNLQLTGKASYLHGEEKYETAKNNGAPVIGTAAKNVMDQVRVGGRVGYWMNGFMPYAGLTYTADIRRKSTLVAATDPLGRQAFVASIGADFFSLASKVTGGISYEQEFNRTNSKNNVFLANINMRF